METWFNGGQWVLALGGMRLPCKFRLLVTASFCAWLLANGRSEALAHYGGAKRRV